MEVWTARLRFSRSPAPKYREMTTPAPVAIPIKKLTSRLMMGLLAPTAANAPPPTKFPTTIESTVL